MTDRRNDMMLCHIDNFAIGWNAANNGLPLALLLAGFDRLCAVHSEEHYSTFERLMNRYDLSSGYVACLHRIRRQQE